MAKAGLDCSEAVAQRLWQASGGREMSFLKRMIHDYIVHRSILGAVLAVGLSVGLAWAQDQPPAGPPGPPPGVQPQTQGNGQDAPSRVARLQYMSGSVSIQPHGTDDWVAGSLNRPLTNSDNVWTDKDSRVELGVGNGDLRMNSESSLTITNVSDNMVQVELHQGTLNVHVQRLGQGESYEVDTPNFAFTVQQAGEYRFEVDPTGDTSVATVWRGEGVATGQGPEVAIHSHESMRFSNGDSLTHEAVATPTPDSFDEWCEARDQRADHSASARYVAPGTIGSEDLDQYGTWRDVAPYGPLWVPTVGPGWAPYYYGNWVWIDPWGWSWVDSEPWGFAPFHYGRWVYTAGYWGWAPGPYWGRPFYAPALVSWFGGPGWGIGFGFGFGFGGVGWCPLGWGEPFFPWYHFGRGYFERVNFYNTRIGNIHTFTNRYYNGGRGPVGFHYANLHAPGGATAVPRGTLTNSLAVNRTGIHGNAGRFGNASLGRVGVEPTRASRLGANAGTARTTAPSRSFSRATFSASGRMNANVGVGARSAEARPNGAMANASRANTGAQRSVPRPPQSMNRSTTTARNSTPNSMAGRNSGAMSRSVPRPPEGARTGNGNSGAVSRSSNSASARSSFGSARSPAGGRGNYVPRPSGPVRPAQNYASNGYGRYSSPGYSGARGYGNFGSRSYGGYSGGYGSAPRYASPSFGSRAYSSGPSYHSSAPSYHGGGGYSARSSGGGGHFGGGGGHFGGGGGHGGGHR